VARDHGNRLPITGIEVTARWGLIKTAGWRNCKMSLMATAGLQSFAGMLGLPDLE
jgi:hypothetical protein